MKFKYYAMFSFVFIIAVFIGVYSMTMESYAIGSLKLPIALWVAGLLLVFFLCSALFYIWGFGVEMLVRKSNENDLDSLIKQIISSGERGLEKTKSLAQRAKDSAKNIAKDLGNELHILNHLHDESTKPSTIKNTQLKALSSILSRYTLLPNLSSDESGSEHIDKRFKLYNDIANGAIEKKAIKLFSAHSPLLFRLWKNYALKSTKNALEVLKDESKDSSIREFAFMQILESKSKKDILKAMEIATSFPLSAKTATSALFTLAKYHKIPPANLARPFCQNLSKDDFLSLANMLKDELNPDEWIMYFSHLSALSEEAHYCYIYVLLELEMIEQANEELKSFSANELQGFRAYIDLKKLGKSYPLSAFNV